MQSTLLSAQECGVTTLLLGNSQPSGAADLAHHVDWTARPWLLPIAAGDVLAAGAVQAYRYAIANSGSALTRVIFADDDILGSDGRRRHAHFKPDWNSELYKSFDYLTGACVLRAELEDLQQLPASPDWVPQLVSSLAKDGQVQHISRVLHHRRSRPRPRLPTGGLCATASLPPVSVIVPTRNRVDLLRTCLEGLARTNYPDLQVIVADNDSDDPATLAYLDSLDPAFCEVLRHPGAFNFSAINNRAAKLARGDLLCLLNNDIEITQPEWLALMARQAVRSDVGAVGAQLLYPDGRIQHAGVVLGIGGGAAHAHRFLRPEDEGYFHRHALPQFVSAVTAACLLVSRARFESVGGLDEANFAVAFNDVDLCMRLNKRGWQTLYEPRAVLVHHESVSRGFDRDPVGANRLAGELAALKNSWGTGEIVDPFHNPNLSPFSEQFVVKL